MNIKIAGKWMFIPLKMVSIGIDPYPCFIMFLSTLSSHAKACWHRPKLRGRQWFQTASNMNVYWHVMKNVHSELQKKLSICMMPWKINTIIIYILHWIIVCIWIIRSWSPTHRRPWCFKHFFGIFFVFWWSCMSTSTQTPCYVMVILGWGWVGWGGAITFMSTCPHTSCYVIVMFSCTCTHTSCYVMVIFSCTCSHTSCYVMVIFSCTCSHTSCYVMVIFSCTCSHTSCYAMVIFSCTCTHTSCYVMVVLGWGWVGWGGAITFMSTCTHTRHATLLLCSLALAHTRHATLWWSSLALAHTRHATLWWSSLAPAHTRHATLWWSSLALAHARHAHHCFCRWKPCLGVTCQKFENQTCQSVSSKQRMDQTNAKNLLFFPVHCGRDANRWQMVERPFQDGCMMESTQKNTLNWKSLSWVTVGENLWDHWHLTGFSKNFARPSKQWSASEKKEKSAASQKNTNLCQKTK